MIFLHSLNCQFGIIAELTFVEGIEFDFGKDIGVIVGLSGNLELLNNKDKDYSHNIVFCIEFIIRKYDLHHSLNHYGLSNNPLID